MGERSVKREGERIRILSATRMAISNKINTDRGTERKKRMAKRQKAQCVHKSFWWSERPKDLGYKHINIHTYSIYVYIHIAGVAWQLVFDFEFRHANGRA